MEVCLCLRTLEFMENELRSASKVHHALSKNATKKIIPDCKIQA